ncbi:hypothetical protein L873DRAFT_1901585 [Choiromyces venosus 120613-1]|uniref:Uncharacterized protein n=1 Tax=Choiromyces venosus 120613-1 TaxID=1336337 RepID=A0A3N4JSV5_9PEZI|nr:hypothetical protein L873DRAFT_1901585 [Choiromyces venosus 120613-1]
MVLHKNTTKAHERKLKAAGKVVDGAAGSAKAKKEVKEVGPVVGASTAESEAKGKEKEEEGEAGDLSGSEDDDQSGSDNEDSAAFRKRTLQNNAWRYEEEEAIPGAEPVIEDPEPDYARLTIGKELNFSHPSSASTAAKNNAPLPIEDIDEEFLRESFQASCTFASTSVPSGSRVRRDHRDEDGGDKLRKVVRVPKSQFDDVTEKISKQTTAEAFRKRFATKKAKPRPELESEEGDDGDSFFEELDRIRAKTQNSKTVTATSSSTFIATSSSSSSTRKITTTTTGGGGVTGVTVGSQEISRGLGRSSGPVNKDDKDDEWLDAMLGGK